MAASDEVIVRIFEEVTQTLEEVGLPPATLIELAGLMVSYLAECNPETTREEIADEVLAHAKSCRPILEERSEA